MACNGYDRGLSDEEQTIRDIAHRFAADVLRPIGFELDKLTAAELIAPQSPLHEVTRRAEQLGFTRTGLPAEKTGMALRPLAQYVILEELAWGNAGLAAGIMVASYPAQVAAASGSRELMEEFVDPFVGANSRSMVGCWGITEPDHGSDQLGYAQRQLAVRPRGQVIAKRDNKHWILRGQKAAWVSNAPVATHAVVNLQLAQRGGPAGGVCIVPLDLPGISRGRPIEKHGFRTFPQGQLFFDDVRIPRHYMVVDDPDHYVTWLRQALATFGPATGCLAIGVARAAYESTLAYCRERIQGDRPIIEHQSVRARLFHMFTLVESARVFCRHAYLTNVWLLANGDSPLLPHGIAAKVFSTRAAVETATLGVQLHGGNGISKEYPLEMFLRDALVLTIGDGENAFLEQVGATFL